MVSEDSKISAGLPVKLISSVFQKIPPPRPRSALMSIPVSAHPVLAFLQAVPSHLAHSPQLSYAGALVLADMAERAPPVPQVFLKKKIQVPVVKKIGKF